MRLVHEYCTVPVLLSGSRVLTCEVEYLKLSQATGSVAFVSVRCKVSKVDVDWYSA